MIMDYRNIFESSLNEARETTQLPDDDKFIKIVKERAVNMEKKKIRSKKPAVFAVSIAAAAVLTVSADSLKDLLPLTAITNTYSLTA